MCMSNISCVNMQNGLLMRSLHYKMNTVADVVSGTALHLKKTHALSSEHILMTRFFRNIHKYMYGRRHKQ